MEKAFAVVQNNNNNSTYSLSQNLIEQELDDHLPLLHNSKMSDGDTSVHCHCRPQDRTLSRQASKQLSVACVLCFIFVVGELLGGYYSGSLAIMSDAAHMFSDFASFGVSLFVIRLSEKKPKQSMTFGYYRAEALGAFATVIIIWYVTGVLSYLAIQRLHSGDFEIHDTAMVGVASAAVLFNVTLGLFLHGMCCTSLFGGHLHGHSHGGHARLHEEGDAEVHGAREKHINIRAALIHVLGDFLQSVGVLVSSVLIKIFGDSCKIVDPICTLMFAVIVLVTTSSVLRDTLRILAEGTPKNINYKQLYTDLLQIPGVSAVHDLHLWSLTADFPAASVHLAISSPADQQMVLLEANKILKSKHNISKTTVQVELSDPQESINCKECQPLET